MPKMNEQLFQDILTHISNGFSLRDACKDYELSTRSFYDYLEAVKEEDSVKKGIRDSRVQQYACAREAQAEGYAQEIIDLADNSTDTNKARLQIDARKWVASKLKPKAYGDTTKHEVTGTDDGPIQITIQTHVE